MGKRRKREKEDVRAFWDRTQRRKHLRLEDTCWLSFLDHWESSKALCAEVCTARPQLPSCILMRVDGSWFWVSWPGWGAGGGISQAPAVLCPSFSLSEILEA